MKNSPLRLTSLIISKIMPSVKLWNKVNQMDFFFFFRDNILFEIDHSLLPGPIHVRNEVENKKEFR